MLNNPVITIVCVKLFYSPTHSTAETRCTHTPLPSFSRSSISRERVDCGRRQEVDTICPLLLPSPTTHCNKFIFFLLREQEQARALVVVVAIAPEAAQQQHYPTTTTTTTMTSSKASLGKQGQRQVPFVSRLIQTLAAMPLLLLLPILLSSVLPIAVKGAESGPLLGGLYTPTTDVSYM